MDEKRIQHMCPNPQGAAQTNWLIFLSISSFATLCWFPSVLQNLPRESGTPLLPNKSFNKTPISENPKLVWIGRDLRAHPIPPLPLSQGAPAWPWTHNSHTDPKCCPALRQTGGDQDAEKGVWLHPSEAARAFGSMDTTPSCQPVPGTHGGDNIWVC